MKKECKRMIFLALLMAVSMWAAGCGKEAQEADNGSIDDSAAVTREGENTGLTREEEVSEEESDSQVSVPDDGTAAELTEEEIQEAVYEKYYGIWTDEEMTKAIGERSQYYKASLYHNEIRDYLENVREIRDIANIVEPLFYTDMKYYSAEDFADVPALVIHIAKNEIYARHGYVFNKKDLQEYFMGCIWYTPARESKDFNDSILNEFEKENIKLLSGLDRYTEGQKAFEWTDKMKETLETMCYTVPDFSGEEELTNEYMRKLLFYTYTGGLCTKGSDYKDGVFYVDENSANALIKLVLGKDYEVAGLTMTPGYEYCYYDGGYVVIQPSDYGDIKFEFHNIEKEEGGYQVTFDVSSPGDEGESWPHIIHIVPADNENGFTVRSVETHYTQADRTAGENGQG